LGVDGVVPERSMEVWSEVEVPDGRIAEIQFDLVWELPASLLWEFKDYVHQKVSEARRAFRVSPGIITEELNEFPCRLFVSLDDSLEIVILSENGISQSISRKSLSLNWLNCPSGLAALLLSVGSDGRRI
jgi:hypothetical protein